MRDIIFRGKREDNGEWINESETYIKDGDGTWLCDESNDVVKVLPETVGQYTGLTDKNGVKIFEGDIVQSLESSVTGLVQWFPEHSAFMVWHKSANEVGFLYECADIIKVIGNIHDNPELLEGSVENG